MTEEDEIRQLRAELADARAALSAVLAGEVDACLSQEGGEANLLRAPHRVLVERERLFRSIFENAHDAILLADDDGRYVDANPAACAMVGLGREELLGLRADDLLVTEPQDLTPEDAEVWGSGAEAVWERFRAEGTQSGVVPFRHADGHVVHAEYAAVADVLPGRHLSILRDQTERLDEEERRRASEERFARCFWASPLALILSTEEGRVVEVNAAATRTLGYDVGAMVGRSEADLELWDDPSRRAHLLAEHLHGEPVRERTVRLRNAAGEPVDVRLSMERLEVGGAPHVLLLFKDVSRERALQEQVQRSQRLEAIGRLAGGVAHDFNNLLGAITGYADLLEEELGEGSAEQEYARQILRSTERASRLTRQLLAFGREQVIQPRVLDLRSLVTDLEPMIRRVMGADVAVRIDCRESALRVRADRAQLEQVVLNLVLNARDAIRGAGTLEVRCALRAAPSAPSARLARPAWAVLSVRDDGVGMDPETVDRIFEPFFTTKGPGRGSGLGLASVYGIIQQHGGRVEVDSAPGRGTRVSVLLPVTDEAVEDESPETQPTPRPSGPAVVLVVEDEAPLRSLLVRFLERAGYSVLQAADGEEAQEVCEAARPPVQVLVTDVVLPGTSGPELAQRLLETHPDVRVLFMSGYAREAADGRGGLPPDARLLQKPFRRAALLEAVDRLLAGGAG